MACANLLFVCADSRFAKPQSSLQGRTGCHFLHRAKSNQKARARTCKKLPVASFCASETAETGRIANGREQGDHVSRRRSGGENARGACCLNGANFPKGKLQKDLILLVESCCLGRLNRGSQNLELPERETDCHFLRRAKSNQKARGTPSCDLDSNLRSIQDFGGNNRPSSSNRPRRVLQGFWVSPVRI